jgi:phosphopantothenoylcysteine synthetase/decarboxylase
MGNDSGRIAPVTVQQSVEGIMQLVSTATAVQLGQVAVGASASASTSISTSSTAADKVVQVPSNLEGFAAKISKENCVFVQFDGELFPW